MSEVQGHSYWFPVPTRANIESILPYYLSLYTSSSTILPATAQFCFCSFASRSTPHVMSTQLKHHHRALSKQAGTEMRSDFEMSQIRDMQYRADGYTTVRRLQSVRRHIIGRSGRHPAIILALAWICFINAPEH